MNPPEGSAERDRKQTSGTFTNKAVKNLGPQSMHECSYKRDGGNESHREILGTIGQALIA